MKEFVTGQLVPFVGVASTIAVLTLAFFDVPPRAPIPVAGLRVPASSEPVALAPSERTRVDDTLTRVLRTLDEGRRAPPTMTAAGTATAGSAHVLEPSAVQPAIPATVPASPSPPPDPKLLDAVSALEGAVRAIHDARTEEDLVHAEDLVRNARAQMDSSCAASGGPLCASADQIRQLGY
ncbi:MAG TPA: hypothetical protein VHC69_23680 [Polyangiaceae bacterium]|nr:hypothetical protein [Polyangiaceae bacterium]